MRISIEEGQAIVKDDMYGYSKLKVNTVKKI